jgi:serralysin
MCWVCAVDKAQLARDYWGGRFGDAIVHLQGASDAAAVSLAGIDGASAFSTDGLIGKEAAASPTVLIVTPDDIANDTSTTTWITVDGSHLISTLNTIGDFDFVKVEMVAGRTYDIGQYAYVGGPSGVPLADAFIEIYDPAGNLTLQEDGGGPNTPNGLDALATFTAQETGTYYINARAFAQLDPNGDSVGDYELFVKDVTGRLTAPPYQAYYDFDSPLHSIDWGSQFARSSRNPDGAEGPRPTGNEYIGAGGYGISGKNVITYYFAKQGDIFLSSNPATFGITTDIIQATNITDAEKAQYRLAFAQYEMVADLVYLEVSDRNQADLKIITYNGTPGQATPSVLGRASPPGEESEGQMEFNRGDKRYNEDGLSQGGIFFSTLLHEYGHAHGLAHPHDDGGRSSIMRGAGPSENPTDPNGVIGGSYGDYGLSQGIFTVMSYNGGWDLRPDGTPPPASTDDNGWEGTLSPLDIAVIQDKYGVNEEYRTGDDVYVLRDVQERGTFYQAIWDAGGVDLILYEGARNAVIDLRDATLQYEEGGGGWVSYVNGINGGYTIANAVSIENATSGSGNDTLIGNEAANVLDGGAGTDTLTGGAGQDTFRFEAGDSAVGSGRDRITDFDGDLIDLSAIGTRFIEGAAFSGVAGQVRSVSFAGSTIIEADANGDGLADLQIELDGAVPLTVDDFLGLANASGGTNGADTLTGTAGADLLEGRGGNDVLSGLGGNDVLNGGAGNDRLSGGAGFDRFLFEDPGTDTITDFRRGDLIDLSGLGVDSSDVTLSKGKVFVELGAEDLTILVQGDSVRLSDLVFASAVASGGSGIESMQTQIHHA